MTGAKHARLRRSVSLGLSLTLLSSLALGGEPAHAEDRVQGEPRAQVEPRVQVEPPPTFAYATAQDADYMRALLELSGVITFGFLWYVTQTQVGRDYDVNYTWPVFRRKLTGESVGFDTNHFGTNFIGHPLGGLGYYLTARSNRLSAAESLGLATAGSVLWEYFGEVRERVSLNDMIVTPLAGIALGEPLTQLGAFFDRSSPSLGHRILGSTFAPLKTLNDQLDGAELARPKRVDRYGFPLDEWHQFDLSTAFASTWQAAAVPGDPETVSQEWRLSLASHLARLPDYDDPGHHSLIFDDANVSSVELDTAIATTGFSDLRFKTQFVAVGHYFRHASLATRGELWGHGTLIGITMGFQYGVHDYDRDRPRPIDKIASVQPLGILLEHRGDLGDFHMLARLDANGSFSGVTPYALGDYRLQAADETDLSMTLPTVVNLHHYYFAVGGSVACTLGMSLGPVEVSGSARYESFQHVGSELPASDNQGVIAMRAGTGIPGTPARVTAFVEHRTRAGAIEEVRAQRSELSSGLAIGARF